MKIVACYKIVPDAQDIAVRFDGSLDLERSEWIIGEYDLVAIEAATRLAEVSAGSAVLLSAGGKELTDSKLIKSALSRGAQELYCVVDQAVANADAFQIASVLAQALKKLEYDLVICGEGSSDLYAQQVGPLLGSLAGVTTINAVSKIDIQGNAVIVERTLEREVEVLQLALPAVISVTTDINLPRIPQLKDILAAGKKPVTIWSVSDVGALPPSNVQTVSTRAPSSIERQQVIYEDASEENIKKLALDIKAAR
ncbi:MAG: putative electron transfer flavoprotein FixA [Coriobacteriales bacterium]|jgi:electron transfer flavoprotein beta subunit|nr:putative electron transfer flavoprotein FixA [Coriobacteriales bacterium]